MEYRLIQKYNAYLIGVHNYYCIATHVNLDFQTIAFDVKKSLYNRLKHRLQKRGTITNRYIKEKYGTSREVRYLNGHAIVPIAYVQHRIPMDKKGKINKMVLLYHISGSYRLFLVCWKVVIEHSRMNIYDTVKR